jgi:hypothetical protein
MVGALISVAVRVSSSSSRGAMVAIFGLAVQIDVLFHCYSTYKQIRRRAMGDVDSDATVNLLLNVM